jgi:aspartyl-tRNA(Asn)/glutamyl-tRNA(Gln) amidotransferase subunit A
MNLPLHLITATELVALYAARKLSPVEATAAALAAIERHNPALNAYCVVDGPRALESARLSEARWMQGAPLGPIDGVPTSVKDLVLTKPWPTLRGSRLVDPDQDWSEDAVLVSHLRRSGAVFLGKTNTPEFGWKGVTDSPLRGITRNPWNPTLTPGGSSGGAAVAAACGMGALHIGTDGGGSIRIPASFTGVVGFKPTFGIVPRHPPSPYGTLSTAGPIARSVADAALAMRVLAEPFELDWYGIGRVPPFTAPEGGVRRWRVAYSPTLSGARMDREIADIVAEAARTFEALGAEVTEVGEVLPDSLMIFRSHWFGGAARQARGLSPEQRSLLDQGFAYIAAQGSHIALPDYLDAVAQREALGSRMMNFFRDWDLMLTPTMPVAAFAVGHDTPPQTGRGQWTDWTPFSYPFNLTRNPAISIPCGFTKAGLPVGLQIIGPLAADQRVLRAAYAFEQTRSLSLPRI